MAWLRRGALGVVACSLGLVHRGAAVQVRIAEAPGLRSNATDLLDEGSRFPNHPTDNTRRGHTFSTRTGDILDEELNLFMQYNKKLGLVVCSCGKCGSTSMYKYMYSKLVGREWDYKGWPWVQDVWSWRWENWFYLKHDEEFQRSVMENKSMLKFALIRDPKERLVSAWKSKVSCDAGIYDTDTGDRPAIVRYLRELAGYQDFDTYECYELEDFLFDLLKVHQMGLQEHLDIHFLPQHLGCFKRYQPAQWSVASEIDQPGVWPTLAERLGSKDDTPPVKHTSIGRVTVSDIAAELLDNITRDEYNVLNEFLSRESRVRAGESVMEEPYLPIFK